MSNAAILQPLWLRTSSMLPQLLFIFCPAVFSAQTTPSRHFIRRFTFLFLQGEERYERSASSFLSRSMITRFFSWRTSRESKCGNLRDARLSENSVRSEIERKFRRQGGKGKITGGAVNATLRIFWLFQRGRRSLQPIAAEGYCRTASREGSSSRLFISLTIAGRMSPEFPVSI